MIRSCTRCKYRALPANSVYCEPCRGTYGAKKPKPNFVPIKESQAESRYRKYWNEQGGKIKKCPHLDNVGGCCKTVGHKPCTCVEGGKI
jgi:hypothetical protein